MNNMKLSVGWIFPDVQKSMAKHNRDGNYVWVVSMMQYKNGYRLIQFEIGYNHI